MFNQVLIFPIMEILHLPDPFLYLTNFRVESCLNQNFPHNSSCPLPVSRNLQSQSGSVCFSPPVRHVYVLVRISPSPKSSADSAVPVLSPSLWNMKNVPYPPASPWPFTELVQISVSMYLILRSQNLDTAL